MKVTHMMDDAHFTDESSSQLICNVRFYLSLCLVLKYISFTYRLNCAMCEMNDLKDHLEVYDGITHEFAIKSERERKKLDAI